MRGLILAAALLAGCSTAAVPPGVFPSYRDASAPFSSIALFEPARYAGTWYEIARYPVPFQEGCVASRAQYDMQPDGTLSVVNTCRDRALDGALRRIEGTARPVGPGRLQVSFDSVPFLTSPYWVLWVDEGYRTAVVGVPSGRAGWILNRDPVIPQDRLNAAREILDFNGYDLSRLEMVPQVAR
ncbi:lipocalin family protein [Oceaniglobus trochenteri]|uniref:lipocalin family protein n=1 Tax=Oceaniglobus trochenteri TaxID=2763260 RepID=UPI001CFFD648|nr:lipocalin family protein [Oceaniglobus trochenteri]